MAQQPPPPSGPDFPHYRGFTITLRHTTVDRTPLGEWSARCRDLYLTTHNIHKRHPYPRRDSNPQSLHASGADPRFTEIAWNIWNVSDRPSRYNAVLRNASMYSLISEWQQSHPRSRTRKRCIPLPDTSKILGQRTERCVDEIMIYLRVWPWCSCDLCTSWMLHSVA